jgi:hypothetical protein
VGRTGVAHTLARSRDHSAHVLVLGSSSWPGPFMGLYNRALRTRKMI